MYKDLAAENVLSGHLSSRMKRRWEIFGRVVSRRLKERSLTYLCPVDIESFLKFLSGHTESIWLWRVMLTVGLPSSVTVIGIIGPDQWDSDMRRQHILERAGWRFWRSFASAFVLHKEDVVQDLIDTLAAHGIQPISGDSAVTSIHVESREVMAFPGESDAVC